MDTNKQHEFKVTRTKKQRRPRKLKPSFATRFVAIDIETTGLNHLVSEIIEISAVRFNNGTHIESFTTLVKCTKAIPYNITSLTGITDKDVESAPDIFIAMDQFLKFIAGDVLVAHNETFDIKFIKKHLDSIGCALQNEIHCTLKLSKKLFPNTENHKLQTITKHLNIDVRQSHRAYEDALSTGYVYLNCLRKSMNDQQIEGIRSQGMIFLLAS